MEIYIKKMFLMNVKKNVFNEIVEIHTANMLV